MKLHDDAAILALVAGKRLRRKSWSYWAWPIFLEPTSSANALRLVEVAPEISNPKDCPDRRTTALTLQDILADDWEVVPETET